MTSCTQLLDHNLAFLRQARDLVADLSDAEFTQVQPAVYPSAIGSHLRHILEHYQCFVAGLDEGRIDYDGRARNRRIEQSRTAATECIDTLHSTLSRQDLDDRDVVVRLDGGAEVPDEDPWSRSTVRRELQYLQAHTVHHFAIMAMILRLLGIEPASSFGMAPSTLRSLHGAPEESIAG